MQKLQRPSKNLKFGCIFIFDNTFNIFQFSCLTFTFSIFWNESFF